MDDVWKAIAAASIDQAEFDAWMREQKERGAALTLGFPGARREIAHRWLGQRVVWWPRGIPPGRLVALISSRLGQALDTRDAWFAVLRATCAKIDAQNDLLITATSTTTDHFVRRCGELFGIRVLCLEFGDEGETLERWLQRVREIPTSAAAHSTAHVSPALNESDVTAFDLSYPARDQAVVALSDRLIVLQVRRGGHQHQLVAARLAADAGPTGSVYVAIDRKLTKPNIVDEFLSAGAIGWMLVEDSVTDEDRPPSAAVWSAPVVPVPPRENWQFLTHWTRRRAGPWPRQDQSNFVDDLVLQRPDADHSALAALSRIVSRQHLIATAETIRGQAPVVSFTALPLADIAEHRVFRPHRSRWDFEGYGICIRRDWLIERGAAAVRYGDEDLWNELPESARPFFQLAQTRGRKAQKPIDWTTEQEWRHLGDVDLSRLPADAALIFVPTDEEAAEIASVSRWPIVVLSADLK